MRNRLESDKSIGNGFVMIGILFLIIGSLDEKEFENRKCPKLVENHPINQY